MKTVIKKAGMLVGVLGSLLLLTGCPGNDKGRSQVVVQPTPPCVVGTPGCLGPHGAGLMINLVSQGPSSAPILMQYSISADAAAIQQISATGQNVINAYTGPITITGNMTVGTVTGYQFVPMGLCGIPGGISLPFQATGTAQGHGIFHVDQIQVLHGLPMTFAARVVVVHSGSAQTAGRAMMELQALQGPNQFNMGAVTSCPTGMGFYDTSYLVLQ